MRSGKETAAVLLGHSDTHCALAASMARARLLSVEVVLSGDAGNNLATLTDTQSFGE